MGFARHAKNVKSQKSKIACFRSVTFGARMQFLVVFGAYLENNVYLCSRFGDDGVFHSGIKGNQVRILSSTRYCHPLVKSPNKTTGASREGGLFGESQETCQDDVTDAHVSRE